MSAASKKDLPPPAANDLGAAMRARLQRGAVKDIETPERQDVAASGSHDVTTSESHEVVTAKAHDVTTSEDHDFVTSPRHEATTPKSREVTTPRRHATKTSRRTGPSASDDPVALTVRWLPDEYDDIDEWMLALRRELGVRKLDKAHVVRTLVKAAMEKPAVRNALLSMLKSS